MYRNHSDTWQPLTFLVSPPEMEVPLFFGGKGSLKRDRSVCRDMGLVWELLTPSHALVCRWAMKRS